MNPIEQFEIHEIFPIAKFGKFEIAFTNSAAYMLIAVAVVTVFMLAPTAGRKLVPSRWQSATEMSYEFVATIVRSTARREYACGFIGASFVPPQEPCLCTRERK